MNLSQQLRQDAMAAGLCEPHADDWNKESVYDLVEYYKANPDWCLERQYPTYQFLCGNFSTAEVQKQGVYVGLTECTLLLDKPDGFPVHIFNQCSGTVTIENWDVGRVYVALGSKMKFVVKDNAGLILDYYDDSEIEIIHESKGRVTVYQYGSRVPKVRGNAIQYRKKDGRLR